MSARGLVLEAEVLDNIGGDRYGRERLNQEVGIEVDIGLHAEFPRILIPKDLAFGGAALQGATHFLGPMFLPAHRSLQVCEFNAVVGPLQRPAQPFDFEALVACATERERTGKMVGQLLRQGGAEIDFQAGKRVDPQFGLFQPFPHGDRKQLQRTVRGNRIVHRPLDLPRLEAVLAAHLHRLLAIEQGSTLEPKLGIGIASGYHRLGKPNIPKGRLLHLHGKVQPAFGIIRRVHLKIDIDGCSGRQRKHFEAIFQHLELRGGYLHRG